MSMIYSGDYIQFPDAVQMPTYPQGWRNRIINGDMRIDQRNAGASVTTSAAPVAIYTVDRWLYYNDIASKRTIQRVADAPAGFTHSLKVTVIAVDNSGPQQFIRQAVEGYNIADLGWGTADAKSITLSFWVKTSVTGQHGGTIQNALANRSFTFAYTVSATNTWEYKTIVVSGPTSGTWNTDNSYGLSVIFEHGPGYQPAAAGTWVTTNSTTSIGSVNLCATNGATWQITGVQLEKGSVATPFEYIDYSEQVRRCQRYFEKSWAINTACSAGNTTLGRSIQRGSTQSSGVAGSTINFRVEKRDAPIITYYSSTTGASSAWNYDKSGSSGTGTPNTSDATTSGFRPDLNIGGAFVVCEYYGHWTASAEL